MNREIKFRAIGLDGNVYYGTYHYSNDKKYHYILNREKFNKYSDEYYYLHDKEVHPINSDTLMQYTGLKDKNGKEIYEGDIMDYGNGRYREVIYKDGVFCMKGLESMAWLLPMHTKAGNIYENPELLK